MDKPTPSDFNASKRDLQEIRNDLTKANSGGAALGIIVMMLAGFFLFPVMFDASGKNDLFAFFWLTTTIVIGPLFYWLYKKNKRNPSLDADTLNKELQNKMKFDLAMKQWEEHSTFSGKQFWMKLRGEELETEFQSLASLVGWDSWLTPVTGDGGIDVICENKRQKRTLLVQCKGHSKPVGVAAIRDAVGVAAIYEGEVLVVCPVGFTKGSFNLARQSSIKLLTATNLVNIANKTEKL